MSIKFIKLNMYSNYILLLSNIIIPRFEFMSIGTVPNSWIFCYRAGVLR